MADIKLAGLLPTSNKCLLTNETKETIAPGQRHMVSHHPPTYPCRSSGMQGLGKGQESLCWQGASCLLSNEDLTRESFLGALLPALEFKLASFSTEQ